MKSRLKIGPGKFKVKLASVGNPDHRQDPSRSLPGVPRRTVSVSSMEAASKVCRDYIGEHELGCGNWAGGEIVENGKTIAKVSYNGRVWYPEDK